MVVQLAHNFRWDPETDVTISKILAVSRREQQANNKKGQPQVTGCLAMVDAYVLEMIQHVPEEGEANATDHIHSVPETVIRSAVIFGIRRLTAGRPEDPTKIYRDLWRFEPVGTNFYNCQAWYYRIFKSNDQRGDFNQESKRSKHARQRGEWSSEVCIARKAACQHHIDYLKLFGYYYDLTAERPVPVVSLTDPDRDGVRACRPFIVGVNSKAHRHKPLGVQRCSATTLELCVKSGGLDEPLTAHHIRHSVLSTVYHWYGFNPDRKQVWDEVIARARHAVDTFLANYHLRVDERTAAALAHIPSSATLEEVLLSGVVSDS